MTDVIATNYYRTFSRLHPVLARIKPDERVSTKTLDSGGCLLYTSDAADE